jgi:AcrR family transcriptional regulator
VAMAAIAEHGLAELTMAGLGRQVGMSAGHLLYYFGSKDQLLLETLRWSEGQLGERRRAALAAPVSAARRLTEYVALYLPTGAGDPRWTLWIEVWGRSLGDRQMLVGQAEIEAVWRSDLEALLREGIASGEFRAVDPARFATRLGALLDGFGTPIVVGLPDSDRQLALDHLAEYLDEALHLR